MNNEIQKIINEKIEFLINEEFKYIYFEDTEVAEIDIYKKIYLNLKDYSRLFSFWHWKINKLFEFMNYKSQTNLHYNAEQSRELIGIIEKIKKLKKLLSKKNINLEIDKYYLEKFSTVEEFLVQSGGSAIPENYQKIEIEEIDRIFKIDSKDNFSVNLENEKKNYKRV